MTLKKTIILQEEVVAAIEGVQKELTNTITKLYSESQIWTIAVTITLAIPIIRIQNL